MGINRLSFRFLKDWKVKPERKPLILRGARQVGKTTLVGQLAQEYQHSILLNLERKDDIQYFNKYSNAQELIQAIFIAHGITMQSIDDTLLFIDEIQESADAITMMRYFYEEIPKLHVIAAGSLLEHVMEPVKSFPVGRVEYLNMFPLNFLEYLGAKQKTALLEQMHEIPVPNYAVKALFDQFHEYCIVGGMPEVVSTFISTNSIADLPPVYESIWGTYKNDVEKYADNPSQSRVIKFLMSNSHYYLDQRIKFEKFGKSNYRSREVGEGFRDLDDARIIRLIYPTTEVEPPIIPDQRKSPRLQFLDTGLLNYELDIQADMLAIDDLNTIYKGGLVAHMMFQELMSLSSIKQTKPNFWVRDKTQSSAEIDLVLQHAGKIVPIEVKSGKEGKLRSLHFFMEQVDHPYAVRLYAGDFKIEEQVTPIGRKPYLLMNLPYFLGTKLKDYINYFLSNYKL